jgi:hypothetical protein
LKSILFNSLLATLQLKVAAQLPQFIPAGDERRLALNNNMPVFHESLSDQLDGEHDDEPGATIMWFGKYASENKRFDELDERYRRNVLKAFRETDFPSENVSTLFISPDQFGRLY